MMRGALLALGLATATALAVVLPGDAASDVEAPDGPVCRYLGPKEPREGARPNRRPLAPLGSREARERDRIQRDIPILQRYDARFPETSGGLSIEAPRRGRVHARLRFTRDLAARRREVRRIWDHRFRVTRVRWSHRHLTEVAHRIGDGRLEAEQITPVGYGPDTRRNRVRLDAVTRRDDADEVVRRLYGEEVRLKVLGPSFYRTRCGVPSRYRVLDPQTLQLTWMGSGSVRIRGGEVRESDTTVRVGVVLDKPYIQTSDLATHTATVTLASPLGDRDVQSIKRRRPVRGR